MWIQSWSWTYPGFALIFRIKKLTFFISFTILCDFEQDLIKILVHNQYFIKKGLSIMFLEVQFNKRSQLTTISTMDIKSRSLTNEDLGKKIMCFCISVVFLCSVFLNAVFCMNQGGHDLKLDSTRVHHKGKTYTPIVFLVKLYCQIIRKQIPPLHYITI